MKTCIAFGDSTMNGYGLKEEETWRYQVGQHFNWEVLNYAINGESSSQALERLDQVLTIDADLVFLNHASNDMFSSQDKYGKIDMQAYENNLRKIIGSFQEKGMQVVFVSPFYHIEGDKKKKTYFYARHNPDNYQEKSPNEILKEAFDRIEKLSKEMNFIFVDIWHDDQLRKVDKSLRNLENVQEEDGSHFSKEGAQRVAELIIEKLNTLGF